MSFGEEYARARRASGMTQPQVVAGIPGMDVPLLSKMESGWCLPVHIQLDELCRRCDFPLDEALRLIAAEHGLKCPKKANVGQDRENVYKLTTRLENELASRFFWALGVLGVSDKTEWVKKYVRLTIKTAERRQKKSAACVAAQTTQSLEKHSTHNIQGGVENVNTL